MTKLVVPAQDMLRERIRHLGAGEALEAIERMLDWEALTDAERVTLIRDILDLAKTARHR